MLIKENKYQKLLSVIDNIQAEAEDERMNLIKEDFEDKYELNKKTYELNTIIATCKKIKGEK